MAKRGTGGIGPVIFVRGAKAWAASKHRDQEVSPTGCRLSIVGRGPVPRRAPVYRTIAGETRSDARMASEGPRATKKNAPPTVGRGPVPRHAPVYRTIAGETRSDARMASEGPRATKKNAPPTVGRGPVPRHAPVYRTIAGETRSDARMASEGPRATKKKRFPSP